MSLSNAKVLNYIPTHRAAGIAATLGDTNIATSSACYSPITSRTASWLSANFIYGDIFDARGAVKGKGMQRVDLAEAPADQINGDSYEDMVTWAGSLFADSFI